MMESELPTETAEEAIPRTLVPWNRDDDKSRFLGLYASGFGIRDALGLLGKAKSTLSAWKHDPVFLDLFENKMPELRKTLALEYASLEFLRNYRLILEKDYRVVKSSLAKKTTMDKDGKPVPIPMDSQDFQYLLKMRAHYNPQQLQAIEGLFGRGGGTGGELNFTDFVLTLSRTTETAKIETRHKQPAQLAPIIE